MKIEWSETAKLTYAEELNFIDTKWGINEVEKFITLTDNFLKTLKTGTFQGKPIRKGTLRMSVISKQTSVFYTFNKSNQKIELISFWNNKQDPKKLEKLLKL